LLEASDSGNTDEILKCLTLKAEDKKEEEKSMKTILGEEETPEMEMLRRDSRFLSTH
jgi:hypothetical protein